ncbi:MAG: DNA alkylation repair protein [Gammaproteobacteria bacterium GWE2_42_36]|nr:MAG: DNA alkylation repair protein [Gammaproteobacteria bacterium GWE2_42_36]
MEKAKILQRFFKTGPGEYGEGDVFLGITIPALRKLAKAYISLDFPDLTRLLQSPIHEERMLSLLILMQKYQKNADSQTTCYQFYVDHKTYINNWDLVDVSAPHIIGHYLFDRDTSILLRWAKSRHLWTKRIAIISTFHFIRQHEFDKTLKIAEFLLHDQHDLIHKAVGWMLREIGKRDILIEKQFLDQYYTVMPRTMLRYAIEKFDEKERKFYLNK